jgi:hypothetical protein
MNPTVARKLRPFQEKLRKIRARTHKSISEQFDSIRFEINKDTTKAIRVGVPL